MDDRSVILRRRAFFVTSALAAVGCAHTAPHAEPGRSEGQPQQVVAVPSASGVESNEPPPPAQRDAGSPSGMPSTDVPPGVSDMARSRYENLHARMLDAHRRLDEIERGLPSGCSPAAAECETRWRATARAFHELDSGFDKFYTCPGSSDDAKAFAVHAQAHSDFLAKRRAVVDERVAKAVQQGGDAASARWQRFRADAEAANPRPCLKFACPDW